MLLTVIFNCIRLYIKRSNQKSLITPLIVIFELCITVNCSIMSSTPREVGVNLKQGYNGDLTSKQAGSVGGQMVNVMCPVRTVHFNREIRTINGHNLPITYEFSLAV